MAQSCAGSAQHLRCRRLLGRIARIRMAVPTPVRRAERLASCDRRPVGELLDQSRLVAPEVEEVVGRKPNLPLTRGYSTRFAARLASLWRWRHELRSYLRRRRRERRARSHLGLAVLRLLAGHETPSDGLAHYSSRLLAGFLRHLDTCAHFYVSARRSDWWDAEIAPLLRGIEWTRDELSRLPAPHYRLVDFNLEP